MTTTLSNNTYWNNLSSDQIFDFDEFFTTNFSFTFNDQYDDASMVIMKEDNESSSSSSETDQEQISNKPTPELTLADLKCGVCGAPACGYNFDQITCESCKAFFRRNALRDTANLRCRFSGSCVITMQTRRHCTYCRLKKCFDIKMRKDWIRTEEEKELRQLQKQVKEQKKHNKFTDNQQTLLNLPIVARKKKRLMLRPTISELIIKPIITQSLFGYNRNLSDDDRTRLNNVTNAYQSVAETVVSFRMNNWIPPSSLIEFINEESKVHESLISYYKSIPEFNQIDIRDRVLLIKFNLIKIVHLHCVLVHKFEENPLIGYYMSQWISDDFHHQMSRTYASFNRFKQHPLILQLALIVLIFSINLSTSNTYDLLDDYTNKKHIQDIQDFYTTFLWRYLNHIYDEREAIQSMTIIMAQILHYQALMNIMEEYVHKEASYQPCKPLESCLFRLP